MSKNTINDRFLWSGENDTISPFPDCKVLDVLQLEAFANY